MNELYKWDGNPVTIKHGYILISKYKEHSLRWYNYEIYLAEKDTDGNYETLKAIIPAIEITTKENHVFHISNHYGIGIYALLRGGTWRQASFHFDGEYEFIEDDKYKISEFNFIGYHAFELKRMAWQRITFPEEYKKIEALQKLIKGVEQKTGEKVIGISGHFKSKEEKK